LTGFPSRIAVGATCSGKTSCPSVIDEFAFSGGKVLCFYRGISTRVPREQHASVQLYRRSLPRIVTMEPDLLQGLLRVNIVVRPRRLVLVFTS
jgi:hypothetical protein